jgi:hypothetical protein
MNDNELIWESFISQRNSDDLSQNKTVKIGNNMYSRNIKMKNGYEVSVVSKRGMSRGGDEGLFEIACWSFEGNDIDPETGDPVGTYGSSTIGNLDFEDVVQALDRISKFRGMTDIESEVVNPREIPRLR